VSQTDIIQREDEQYRRGVVLGLTLAEVTILLLFCLLMTALVLIEKRQKKIDELVSQQGNKFVVSAALQEFIEDNFGDVTSQKELDDNFLKLSTVASQAQQTQKIVDEVSKAVAVADNGRAPKDLPQRVAEALQTESTVKAALAAMDKKAAGESGAGGGIDKILTAAQQLVSRGELFDTTTRAGKDAAAEAMSKSLCEMQYDDPALRRECIQKIATIAGGKGLEFRSCWWDKTVAPWRTKNIYEVALTDYGFIIRELDPEVEEYRVQKANDLPVASIRANVPLTAAEFVEQTFPLFQWSEVNECRFYVRVYDETGPTEKNLFKSRLTTLEQHFYKELTNRRF
jgi:hypothetical protein